MGYMVLSCYIFITLNILMTNVAAKETPNIIVIIADDLGIGDLGCYGNKTLRTPNIDMIASSGMTFTHNLAPESVCTPSRAAMLTGRYAKRLGLAAKEGDGRVIIHTSATAGLNPSERTYATILKKRNYSTGYFGKWHLGIHCVREEKDFCHFPLSHGYDYYYGMPLTNVQDCAAVNVGSLEIANPVFEPLGTPQLLLLICLFLITFFKYLSLQKLFIFIAFFVITIYVLDNLFWQFIRHTNCIVMRNYDVVEQPVNLETITEKLTNEIKHFITEKKDEKFLLTVAYQKVHTALKTTHRFTGRSKHGKYGDAVEEMDWSVGEIISHLTNLGILNNTVVFFTSDHGPALYMSVNGEYHGGSKGTYKGGKLSSFEGGVRVPMLVMWPDGIAKGSKYIHPTSSLDLYPTLLSLAKADHDSTSPDVESWSALDGYDMVPVLKGKQTHAVSRFIFHYCGNQLEAVTYKPTDGLSVWKLHYQIPVWPEGLDHCIGEEGCSCYGKDVNILEHPLLFDLHVDHGESQPISVDSDVYNPIVQTINAAVKKHNESFGPVDYQLSWDKNGIFF